MSQAFLQLATLLLAAAVAQAQTAAYAMCDMLCVPHGRFTKRSCATCRVLWPVQCCCEVAAVTAAQLLQVQFFAVIQGSCL
jgi:hypothetical protein